MAMKLFAFLRKAGEPTAPVQAFARRWTRQFKLYTRSELKEGAATVADAYQADLSDRAQALQPQFQAFAHQAVFPAARRHEQLHAQFSVGPF